jgi:D-beta-D-heptose 7-phosphate kinase / D-beta-D-heptose 1-phosphate adenosyltransferase
VSAMELRARILPAAALAAEDKIVFDWTVADECCREWRHQGLRVGFTNGCFDPLHPGHIQVLIKARGACDRLVLGLNGNGSVRRLNGEGPPTLIEVMPGHSTSRIGQRSGPTVEVIIAEFLIVC